MHFQQDSLIWSGLVESKIRHLIAQLERHPAIALCHIHPKYFLPLTDPLPVTAPIPDPVCRVWFIGLDLNKQLSRNIDIQNEVQSFLDIVTSAAHNQCIYNEGMSVLPQYLRRAELPRWLKPADLARGRKATKKVKYNATLQRQQQSVSLSLCLYWEKW
ncbi:unnamed protein product [Gongylonema pulchrum]|uniref:UV-damage endonuclease n=1 Tax=Gongylonema pulchrum TaxID=637853 RepID=A0A183E0I1_9BILA|nr:unnamed protein product [Gongylonema pulchrum]